MRLGQEAMQALRAQITGQLYPDQELVVTRWIGRSGTYRIVREKYTELGQRFSRGFLEDALGLGENLSVQKEWSLGDRLGVSARYALGEGGIFSALWKMAEAGQVGLEIDLRKIPIRQETIEVCEPYDINPYQMESYGAVLVGTANAPEFLRALEQEGIPGAIIGHSTCRTERLLHNQGHIRYLDRPGQDEICKLNSIQITKGTEGQRESENPSAPQEALEYRRHYGKD